MNIIEQLFNELAQCLCKNPKIKEEVLKGVEESIAKNSGKITTSISNTTVSKANCDSFLDAIRKL